VVIGGAVGLVGYLLLKVAMSTSRARRLEGAVD
jgi:hypothetical protein